MNESSWDVIIVGGGSAGLSAALMLVRARRRVLVLDAGEPRNRVAPHMHGVLGRDGTSPLQLLADGRREVEGYGGRVLSARATAAEREGAGFVVTTDDGSRFTARRLVVATGMRDELLPVPGLAEQWGTGVVTCPYCDGWEVRDRRIAVVATDEHGPLKAQLLRQWSADVMLFTNGEPEPAEPQRAALTARGIRVEARPIARVVDENGRLAAIELTDGERIPVDAIFANPAPLPSSALLDALDPAWSVADPSGRTTIPGVWVAGNVANPAATVPVSMASGAQAGAMANFELVEEDVADALWAMAQA
ncbi:NAD(P)/FAD-dependent oxidoreductase [Leifsonia sp. NPDC058292]|uniref:NAD(P)/FAD-dependent oxidoreductase n=1 Tax=Leifsonia sp. NPDC058292 TaxID=3346428 RepID=UPI0036DAAB2E